MQSYYLCKPLNNEERQKGGTNKHFDPPFYCTHKKYISIILYCREISPMYIDKKGDYLRRRLLRFVWGKNGAFFCTKEEGGRPSMLIIIPTQA